MQKDVIIGGRSYTMRASALIPRQYRYKFGRDLIQDMQTIQKEADKAKKDPSSSISPESLTCFENIAWLMLKAGGEDVKESPDEWLDSLDGVFDVYSALPEMLELYGLNLKTTAKPAKK